MDARERLRVYLEQRREMGESEFMLDSLPVEDVLRLIGDRNPAPAPREASGGAARDVSSSAPRSEAAPVERSAPATTATNWRDALTSIGADGSAPPTAQASPAKGSTASTESTKPSGFAADAESRGPAPAAPSVPGTGIIVGNPARIAAGGPLAGLATLDEVARHVASCQGCALHATAKNSVPGEGNPQAGFVCVGEAPGQTEDELGRPFVGRAGDLLTKILDAIQLKREDVFICNVLKHRPPGNRNPASDEIAACSPYLLRQLELLQPRVILALGTFASQTLLQTTQPIGKLRGLVHRFHGVPLICTYHPAALLRNPAWKRPTWEDVQLARRIFDSAAQG